MHWQEVATLLTVLGAVAYLFWKMGPSSRTKKPSKSKGPDVPLRRLTEKRRKS